MQGEIGVDVNPTFPSTPQAAWATRLVSRVLLCLSVAVCGVWVCCVMWWVLLLLILGGVLVGWFGVWCLEVLERRVVKACCKDVL